VLRSSCSCCSNNNGGGSGGCTEQEEKKVKKKRAPKAATSGPDVRVNSHVAAITVVIFTTKAFFSFFFISFSYKFLFIHVCAQLLTLVIYAIFNCYLVILPHRSFILNEYEHTRVAKATIYSFSIISFDYQKRRKINL